MYVFSYITFGAFCVFVVFRNQNTFQNPIYLEGAYFNTIYFIYKRSVYGSNLTHQKQCNTFRSLKVITLPPQTR